MSKIVINPKDSDFGQSVPDYSPIDSSTNGIRKISSDNLTDFDNTADSHKNNFNESKLMNDSILDDSKIEKEQNFVKNVPNYIDTYDNQINQFAAEINKGNAFENLIFWFGILFFIISTLILLYFILKYFNVSIF